MKHLHEIYTAADVPLFKTQPPTQPVLDLKGVLVLIVVVVGYVVGVNL